MIDIKHKQSAEVLVRVNAECLDGVILAGAQLAGANLAGLSVNHAQFRDANLHGAVFTGSQLIGTCFDGANLAHAIFNHADLTDASLERADLSRAHFIEATMRYTRLAGANLTQADLTGANLSMADARANLRDANLQATDLRGANLDGANLQHSDLFQADLRGAFMSNASVVGARTQGAKMQGVISQPGSAMSVNSAVHCSIIRRAPPRSDVVDLGSMQGNRLPVVCPYCNHQQEIPLQSLEHHSRCALCQEKFFIDRLGHAHEHKTADSMRMQWTPELQSAGLISPGAASSTWEWPKKLTKPLIGTIAGLILGWLLWRFIGYVLADRVDVPQGLIDRAVFVGEAYAAGDALRILAVTESGMSDTVKEWLAKQRSANWDKRYEANSSVQVEAKMLFENKASKRAGVLTDIRRDPQIMEGHTTPLEAQFVTFWQQDVSGQWLLDAKSTADGGRRRR